MEASKRRLPSEILRNWQTLDDFLREAPTFLMFWFFQRREIFLSQTRVARWSRDRLEDYVLLPAQFGFVWRTDRFFISHFWQCAEHPDPNGEYLRLHQENLKRQRWSFVWLDWTCMPQNSREEMEEKYFLRSLETMPGIIRNSGFNYHFPPFKPRLWILFEVASYMLTAEQDWDWTPDIRHFVDHVREMVTHGVRSVLLKYHYECTFERDETYLTAWLELLVLLRQILRDVDDLKRVMDHLMWSPTLEGLWCKTPQGGLHIEKIEGRLAIQDEGYSFTPFPRWVSSSPVAFPVRGHLLMAAHQHEGKFAIPKR